MYIYDFFQNFLKTFLVWLHGNFTSSVIAPDMSPREREETAEAVVNQNDPRKKQIGDRRDPTAPSGRLPSPSSPPPRHGRPRPVLASPTAALLVHHALVALLLLLHPPRRYADPHRTSLLLDLLLLLLLLLRKRDGFGIAGRGRERPQMRWAAMVDVNRGGGEEARVSRWVDQQPFYPITARSKPSDRRWTVRTDRAMEGRVGEPKRSGPGVGVSARLTKN